MGEHWSGEVDIREHVRKTIRQEDQQGKTYETADNGLSQIGSLTNLANVTAKGREPSPVTTVLSPASAPIVVLSSTGPSLEQVGDGSSSDTEERNSQPVFRLRGGAPEELDDDGAFYEPGQVAQPVTAIGH